MRCVLWVLILLCLLTFSRSEEMSSCESTDTLSSQAPPTTTVVIVGAGLSGLTCAYSIASSYTSSSALRIVILESNDRIGGRAHSQDGVDLGGAWLWPPHQTAIRLAKEVGASMFKDDATTNGEVRMSRGMQSFVQQLYESSLHKSDRVTVELKLSHFVSDIKRVDQDFHILAHDRDAIICKHVVVAIPPRLAARNMGFEPALSSTLRSAMLAQNTWMGATAKIAFVFDKPWWKSNINSARFGRDSVIFQMMQSTVPASETKAATHVLVAFAQPPASAKVPFAVVKDASQAEADVRDWLSSATRDVLSLSSSSTPPSQIAYHTWRQDRSCFCTDGQNPAAHMSYFQHPHVGDFVLRQAVTFGNSALLFCASETDDESPGMLDGAVRSGQRAAKTLLHIIGKA